MIRLEIKNYNIILTEKQQKQHYHQVRLINTKIFQVKKYYLLIKIECYNNLSLLIRFKEALMKKKKKNGDQRRKQAQVLKLLRPGEH